MTLEDRPGPNESGQAFDARLKSWPIPPLEQVYRRQDVALYALSVGMGAEPIDPAALPYMLQEAVEPLPTFPTVLAANSPWLFDPDNGVDSRAILLRELSIRVENAIPPEGTAVFHERVDAVWDRGADRGAQIHLVGPLMHKETGVTVATIERVTIALRNGGFGGSPPPTSSPLAFPAGEPDHVHVWQTRSDAALLFRLHGDLHPVHWDAAFAAAMGYPKPLLHGMCTLGVVAHGLVKDYARYERNVVKSLRMLFKAPVFPGETLRTSFWPNFNSVLFRTSTNGRGVVVAEGSAELAPSGQS